MDLVGEGFKELLDGLTPEARAKFDAVLKGATEKDALQSLAETVPDLIEVNKKRDSLGSKANVIAFCRRCSRKRT